MKQYIIWAFLLLICSISFKNTSAQCTINFCEETPVLTADAPYFDIESSNILIDNITIGNFGCEDSLFNSGIAVYIYQMLPNGERMFQCTVLNEPPNNTVAIIPANLGYVNLCGVPAFNLGTIPVRPENGFEACDGATYEIEIALYISDIVVDIGAVIYDQIPESQYIFNTLGTVDVHLTDAFPGNAQPLTTAKLEESSSGATGMVELNCGEPIEIAVEALSRLSNCPDLEDITFGIPSEMTNEFFYSIDGAPPVILRDPSMGAAGGQLTGSIDDQPCYAGLLGVRTIEFNELEGLCEGSTLVFTVKSTDLFTNQTAEDQITFVYTGAACDACASAEGCTDDTACNYDPEATVNDGSCTYPEPNFDCEGNCLVVEDCAGTCGGTATEDCENVCAGSATEGTTCDDGNPATSNDVYDSNCNCIGMTIAGCTNINACNYNPEATIDDDSCRYESYYFNCNCEMPCPAGFNQDTECNCISQCGPAPNPGEDTILSICQNDEPFNLFEALNGTPDEGGEWYYQTKAEPVGAITNFIFTPGESQDGVYIYYFWRGDECENPSATIQITTNFISVTIEEPVICEGETYTLPDGELVSIEGSYETILSSIENCDSIINTALIVQTLDCEGACGGSATAGTTCDDGDPATTGDVYNSNCNCVGQSTPGCIDDTACNYNPDATVDDGSCTYPEPNFDCMGNCLVELDCEGTCGGTVIEDCENVCGGSATAGTTCDDGDPATTDDVYDGNCNCVGESTPGCIDDMACNYNPEATIDDDSCRYESYYFNCNCEEPCPAGFNQDTDCECISQCGPAPNPGEDTMLSICQNDEPFDLFEALNGTPEEGGEWYYQSKAEPFGAITNLIFTPGESQDGVYLYFFWRGDECENPSATIQITTNPISVTDEEPVICEGETYTLPNGEEVSTEGSYETVLSSIENCDSIIFTGLTVQALDCEGVCGGSATAGTACDDGDPTTTGDVFDGNCNCVGEATLGCIDDTACNYNPEATVDDGSCTYPEPNFDCLGNCLGSIDCAEVCGGPAIEDCLGVCNGSANEGSACDDGNPNTIDDKYDANCVCRGVTGPVGCTSLGGTLSFSEGGNYSNLGYICNGSNVVVDADDFVLLSGQEVCYVFHQDGEVSSAAPLQNILQYGSFLTNNEIGKKEIYVTAYGAKKLSDGSPDFTDPCLTYSNTLAITLLNPVNISVDEECDNSQFTFTINVTGGLPECVPSSSFEISGDYFVGTLSHGQSQTVGPITDAENYIVTATDENGCTHSVSKSVNCTKLPIQLIEFSGKVKETGNLLKWATSTEIENDYFTLQYSTTGKDFEKIATIKGKGTTSETSVYEFLHREALNGIGYYKLLQTDFDGTTTQVKTVELLRGESTHQIVDIYPIPVKETLNIIYQLAKVSNYTLMIYNATGEIVYEISNEGLAGNNLIELDIQNFSAGMYMAHILSDDAISSSKFIVE